MDTTDALLRLIQIKYPQLNAYQQLNAHVGNSRSAIGGPVTTVIFVDSQDGKANLVDIYYTDTQLTIYICRGEKIHINLAQEGSIDIIYNCVEKAIELECKARTGLSYKRHKR